jgi:hypothetical protein
MGTDDKVAAKVAASGGGGSRLPPGTTLAEPDDNDPRKFSGERPHRPEIRLGREAQAQIGELLRAMYNSYVNEGVPQHFEELVRRLGEQE